MALIKPPPPKPFKAGKINQEFGGPAESPLEVLERARVAISPRGAWSSSGWSSKNPSGYGRCLLQLCRDVDGVHVTAAENLLSRAIRRSTPTVPLGSAVSTTARRRGSTMRSAS